MTQPASRKLSKAALCALIFGLLGCVPAVGLLGIAFGIPGFLNAGKPGMRGQGLAITGIVLGLLTVGGWSIGAYFAIKAARTVATIYNAPGVATQAYIQALAAGDEVTARKYATVSADELKSDGDIIRAQGAFVKTDFNYTQFNEGGSSHITGYAQFAHGSLWVKADLHDTGTQWVVESAEFTVRNP